MSVIANKCPDITVNVVDINEERIKLWNDKDLSKLPIYEPGLKELVHESRNKNLFFNSNIKKAIREADIIFISVNTPTKTFGKGKGEASDLKYIESCARTIAKYSENDKIVVEKSTLPVRTAELIKDILVNTGNGVTFQIISNPEFLAEGTAINDLLFPDRVLIGGEQSPSGVEAQKAVSSIYERWIPKEKILLTNVWSSELSKLVANAFLAQRVSSINSISELCESTDADISEVSKAIGLDSRIGSKFLNASVGFGGSCFQKDILNLVYISRTYGLDYVANYWEQVIKINHHQRTRFSQKIVSTLYNTVSEKKIALFGWSFKKNTNDSRESPSIYVADNLIDEHARLTIYDPMVSRKQIYADLNSLGTRSGKENIKYVKVVDNPYKAIQDAHAIVVLTEWDEFKDLNWKLIKKNMLNPSFIFDGRNILDKDYLSNIGFNVFQIGKP